MNEEILKLADLSNVKVGDTIWTIQDGEVEVIGIVQQCDKYPINTKMGHTYALDGRYRTLNKYPSAFLSNPFENIGFKERWMMVSDTKLKWVKRRVFMQKNEMFLAWDSAKTDEKASEAVSTVPWRYAKEIEEPKELELTLEQIAEKFGVSVESIKIKK